MNSIGNYESNCKDLLEENRMIQTKYDLKKMNSYSTIEKIKSYLIFV